MELSLKEHRRRVPLSTRELAEKAGVLPSTVWRIENGTIKEPHPKTMRKIAEALGVKVAEIAEFAPREESS